MAPRSREGTQAAILEAGTALFAERGVADVSIRDIAAAAGVSHTLVHFYFGSKEELVGAILNREARRLNELSRSCAAGPMSSPEAVKELMRIAMTDLSWVLKLQVQAGIARLQPEMLVDHDVRVLAVIEEWMRLHQGELSEVCGQHDTQLMCAVVVAAIMAFGTVSPWIMTSVGLAPEDFDSRVDEIIDIMVAMLPGTAPPSNA